MPPLDLAAIREHLTAKPWHSVFAHFRRDMHEMAEEIERLRDLLGRDSYDPEVVDYLRQISQEIA